MGKEGELWDDSALIKAFDHAISKYKTMHVKSGEKAIIDTEENLPAAETDSQTTECLQNCDEYSNRLETITNIEETAEILENKQESPLELYSSAKCVGFPNNQEHSVPSTNGIPAAKSVSPDKHTVSADLDCQYETTCYSDASGEYSKLLNKYYEIESERQHILQQLNQYSNWNAQENQTSVPQPYETVACDCPYGCQSWVVPCNSPYAACSGGYHVDTTSHAKVSQNSDFVNTAMAAADKALALTKQATRGKDKQVGMEKGQLPESKSGTDLDVVLNAWYSAGFYTGKYLSEQSPNGRKQGEGGV